MFTEISTDDKGVAQAFISEHLNGDYAMLIWSRDASGRYRLSINTDIEPETEPTA